MSRLTLECRPYNEPFDISATTYEYIRQYCASSEYKSEFKRRSHLFVPLNKVKFLEKIGRGEVAADGFIWDLEDSVPVAQKPLARAALANVPPKLEQTEYNVRINCGEPAELARDLEVLADFPCDSITLPKSESARPVLRLMRIIGENRNYVITIETLNGLNAVADIASILRPGRDALGLGIGDMSTDLGVERTPTYENPLFQQILGVIAMTGKRYNLELFDSVSARFNDSVSTRKEAELSCHYFGYTGKKLINPKQLEVINKVFSPSQSRIALHLSTLESFLAGTQTNAHVVCSEYKGMPAFRAADQYIKKLLRQGYLTLGTPDENQYQ